MDTMIGKTLDRTNLDTEMIGESIGDFQERFDLESRSRFLRTRVIRDEMISYPREML
jgi:hypothetical protein